jgi:hypothetical protein
VRDDVERALATRVGAMPAAYTKAMPISQQLQAAITVMSLIDVATGDRIQVGDTNYRSSLFPDGLYLYGKGAFNLPQFGNNVTTGTYMEYRLTVAGTQVTLERGTSLANLTEIVTGVLATSIAGKTFYLNIGTGGPNYCPAVFDWVTVKTYE